jgi:hypothetical protein
MKNQMNGHVARMGEMRNAQTRIVGKPQGKRPREKLIWDVQINWV